MRSMLMLNELLDLTLEFKLLRAESAPRSDRSNSCRFLHQANYQRLVYHGNPIKIYQNRKIGGSCSFLGPFWARIQTRLAEQRQLCQISPPQRSRTRQKSRSNPKNDVKHIYNKATKNLCCSIWRHSSPITSLV